MKLSTVRRLVCLSIAAAFVFVSADKAEARAQYNKAFKSTYADDFDGKDVKINCNVCHGKSKKKRSQYAEDLTAKIGKKNQKDADAIVKALKEVEAMKSQTDGKTYGELIHSGVLPAPYSE